MRHLTTLLALPLLALLCGCPSTPNGGTKVRPPSGTDAGFVGQIQPERDTVAVGEDLFVDYSLRWLGAQPLTVEVADPSKDPDMPFHGFTFNGALASNPKVSLDLVFLGPQPLGRQVFAAGGALNFARIRWRAKQPGIYRLTFQIEWHEGQLITFEPVDVEVTGVGGEAAPVDPEKAKQADALIAELGKLKTLPARKQRTRRAEIRAELVTLGAPVAAQLVRGLDSTDDETQTTLVRALLEVGPTTTSAVIGGLAQGTIERRTRCAFVLGQLRAKSKSRKAFDGRAVQALRTAAGRDPSPQVREVAYDVLGRFFDDTQSVPALLDGLADGELRVRRTCQRALTRLAGAKAVSFDPKAAPAERSKAIQAWRTLWASRGIK